MTTGEEPSREIALKLCEEIQIENQGKGRISFEKVQCWGCLKHANGDVEKMCLANERSGGCNLIIKRYKLQQEHK